MKTYKRYENKVKEFMTEIEKRPLDHTRMAELNWDVQHIMDSVQAELFSVRTYLNQRLADAGLDCSSIPPQFRK